MQKFIAITLLEFKSQYNGISIELILPVIKFGVKWGPAGCAIRLLWQEMIILLHCDQYNCLDERVATGWWMSTVAGLGPVSIRKTVFPGMGIPMLKIRRPVGRLIFNMGIAIPSKTVFLIETAPWSPLQHAELMYYMNRRRHLSVLSMQLIYYNLLFLLWLCDEVFAVPLLLSIFWHFCQ